MSVSVQVAQRSTSWIAYVGPFGFPDGGAAARRVLGNAQSLVSAGFNVVIASGQQSDCSHDAEYCPGIHVVSLGERDVEHWPRPLRRLKYLGMGRATRRWLDAQPDPPAAVILYSGYSPYLLRLLPWCRRNYVPLIFDAVEWYEASSALDLLTSPYQWNIELAMRWLIKRTAGVIAISSFLSEHFQATGPSVLTVPPTLDVSAIATRPIARSDDRLQLCYAGTPGTNKDLIDEVVAAVVKTDLEGHRLVLNIAGIEKQDLLTLPSLAGHAGRLPGSISCHGRLPHNAAISLVQGSDFTILVRPDNRVSRAGFSTKFVESLAVGTPVIGNITGDLGRFLRHLETGLVSEGPSAMQLQEVIQTALSLSPADLDRMRLRCREVAFSSFDFHVYALTLGSFVRALIEQYRNFGHRHRNHHADK